MQEKVIANEISGKLQDVMKRTGYPIVQKNGQRIFGPPSDWVGPPPPRGTEVFVGKLPRDIYEDELVPIFLKVGRIYNLRLMMDFSGSNRGYAFVSYATKAEASAAAKQLNNYEIRPRRNIGVVASVDNSRLFIGNIPKNVNKKDVLEELSCRVEGIVDVIMYENIFNRKENRGYAFVEFISHRAAAMARRVLVPGCVHIWNRDISVDWAEPEPEVSEDQMQNVKVLFVRNFNIRTTSAKIQATFESAINTAIEKVKKIDDYAFIHFFKRGHAIRALMKLQNSKLDGCKIKLQWAKPVDSQLYHLQKLQSGNSKFNDMVCYKQNFDWKENASTSTDEGIESNCAADNISPIPEIAPAPMISQRWKNDIWTAPAGLEVFCNSYQWPQPNYKFRVQHGIYGNEIWVCFLELPHVGSPFLDPPRSIGPIYSTPNLTSIQAKNDAAATALHLLKQLGLDLFKLMGTHMYQPVLPASQPYMLPWVYPMHHHH